MKASEFDDDDDEGAPQEEFKQGETNNNAGDDGWDDDDFEDEDDFKNKAKKNIPHKTSLHARKKEIEKEKKMDFFSNITE
mmetsp:Transcript_15112/g.12829  ORF Transcript_15112/g.12829 Transcript_15112/m.12829 type:complete len:80 (+) Transcript_15112:1016-1255(+)